MGFPLKLAVELSQRLAQDIGGAAVLGSGDGAEGCSRPMKVPILVEVLIGDGTGSGCLDGDDKIFGGTGSVDTKFKSVGSPVRTGVSRDTSGLVTNTSEGMQFELASFRECTWGQSGPLRYLRFW